MPTSRKYCNHTLKEPSLCMNLEALRLRTDKFFKKIFKIDLIKMCIKQITVINKDDQNVIEIYKIYARKRVRCLN